MSSKGRQPKIKETPAKVAIARKQNTEATTSASTKDSSVVAGNKGTALQPQENKGTGNGNNGNEDGNGNKDKEIHDGNEDGINDNEDGNMRDENQVNSQLPSSAEAKQFQSTQQSIHRLAEWVTKDGFKTFSYSAISLRHDRLSQLWNKGNDLFFQMLSDLDDTTGLAASYQDSLDIMEEEYYEAAEAMLDRMKELEPKVGSVSQPASEVVGTESEQKVIKVQMPVQQHDMKNTWGHFDGDSMKWLGFRDRFTAAIHNNADVSDAYKHSYLIDSLKGAAADALGQSHETKGSYTEAWNRLMELYNKPYKIARDYMRQFYRLPVLHTRATSAELQRMSNTTHETIRQLRALDLPIEQWDFVFVHSLHERLDNETAREWEKHRGKDGMPTAKEMLAFLDQEASASANSSNVRQSMQITIGTDHRTHSKDRSSASGTATATGTASNTGAASYTGTVPKKIPCEACPQGSQQYHPLYYCPNFEALNLNARNDFIKRRRICPNCLRKGHGIASCNDNRRCTLPQCQGNSMHNSMICPHKQKKQVLTLQEESRKRSNAD